MPLLPYLSAVLHEIQTLARAFEYLFVAQTDVPVHAVLLDVIWQPVVYVPAAASVHLVCPVEDVYVPAAHGVCVVAPVVDT